MMYMSRRGASRSNKRLAGACNMPSHPARRAAVTGG